MDDVISMDKIKEYVFWVSYMLNKKHVREEPNLVIEDKIVDELIKEVNHVQDLISLALEKADTYTRDEIWEPQKN